MSDFASDVGTNPGPGAPAVALFWVVGLQLFFWLVESVWAL
jgi:hypothetical protein